MTTTEISAVERKAPALHPDTTNPATLVDRLRDIYRIEIKDGLGAVGAGDEPENPHHYVKHHASPPIQRAAADEIEKLRAEKDDLLGALKTVLSDIECLMGDSEGVAGLHRNGDLAPWGDLTDGGSFGDWLPLDYARAAIAKAEGRS